MSSLPSCKSEVSPRFVLLSQPSLSLLLLQQKLVWVSRLGWPRTEISETQFFSESILKLIIWSGTWSCLGCGTNEKKVEQTAGAQSFSSDLRSAYRPPLCSPMMSYADNEWRGKTQCFPHMCVFHPPDAPPNTTSPTQRAQIIHTRLYLDPTAHLDH